MSPKPAKFNLEVWRGATFTHRFTYYTGADDTTPPVDLTGWTATLRVRPTSTLDSILLTTENGGVELGGESGTIDVLLDAGVTADLNWQTAVYELLLVDGDGETIPLVWGSLRVRGV